MHAQGCWQVSRNGSRIGIYASRAEAVRSAAQQAGVEQTGIRPTQPSTQVVIHNDEGHIEHRTTSPESLVSRPEGAVNPDSTDA